MLRPYEIEQMQANKIVISQLLDMANKSFRANQLAENTAHDAKLAALRLREELKVRLEMINESLEIHPPEPEYAPTREDSRADDADNQNKERDEHEDNPGAA